MFAGKQFDIVMGVDIHIIQPPGPVPPVPVPHPFIGMVYDPFEFIPFIGASSLVNGLPRAQAGTNVVATMPHIPLGGVFVKPPSNDGEIYMGSISVPGEGEPFSFMGCPVLTCQDAGMVSIPRFNRKSKAKPKSLVLPTSILICVPKGGINIIPTGMIISLKKLAFKIGLTAFAKLLKKIPSKLEALRRKKAENFYRQFIKDEEKLQSHLDGIDFSKPVKIVKLKEGTEIQQWVKEGRIGAYFTSNDNKLENLGLNDYDERVLTPFKLKSDTVALESTCADFAGGKGGGIQYYSPEIKNNI